MIKKNFIRISLIIILSFFYSNIVRAQNAFPDFISLAEKTANSYVNIYTEKVHHVNASQAGTENSEFMPSGSGFVVSSDGYIVTNYHVVKNILNIKVLSYRDIFYDAKLIGFDEETDIAILKIETLDTLFPAKLANSNDIKIGEWVLAIGNPFGIGASFSKGIISAKNRKISDHDDFNEFIQTDVSINQGNSGGPLFNLEGKIIGVNSMLFSTNGMSSGISFAIPSNIVNWVYLDIVKQHRNGVKEPKVLRGTIGLKFQKSIDSKHIIISGIEDINSESYKNLEIGDIIIKFNGNNIDNLKNLNRLILQSEIDSYIYLTILKNDIEKNIELKVFEKKAISLKNHEKLENEIIQDNYIKEIGIEFFEKENKIYIKYIDNDSEALAMGVNINSQIIKIDKKDVFSIKDIRKSINEAILENNRPITILLDNNGHNFVNLRINKNV